MEWLNDPKNRPIVIGAFCVILLVTAVIGYMTFFAGGGEAPMSPEASTPPADAGAPPMSPAGPTPGAPATPGAPTAGAPGAPAAPGAAPGTPGAPAATPGTPGAPVAGGAPKPAAVAKLEKFRADPFLPLDWVNPDKRVKEIVQIPMPGRMFAPEIKTKIGPGDEPEMPQPPRRMAGILFNERVYAIIERNGAGGATTMIVKPGDITDDGMRVERIEPNKVVLVTTTGKQRRVDVKMAASQRPEEGQMQQQQRGMGAPMGGPMVPGSPFGGQGRYRGPMDAPAEM